MAFTIPNYPIVLLSPYALHGQGGGKSSRSVPGTASLRRVGSAVATPGTTAGGQDCGQTQDRQRRQQPPHPTLSQVLSHNLGIRQRDTSGVRGCFRLAASST